MKALRRHAIYVVLGICFLLIAPAAHAEGTCTGEQIQKMLQSGFTKNEILRLCGGDSGGSAGGNYQTGKEGPPASEKVKTVGDVLNGHRWVARSHSLVFESLEATFNSDGSFDGVIETSPQSTLHKPGPLSGRWQLAKPLLFIKYVDVMGGYPSDTEHTIKITEFNERRIVGVDKYLRMWEFVRRD